MTKQRIDKRDGVATEFSDWLRNQYDIDSSLGFITSNIDYVWMNYKTGEFMLIEEKRYKGKISFSQEKIFQRLDDICKKDSKYKGFHTIIFEKTKPDDGWIKLDGKMITRDELILFLKFKNNNPEL